MADDKKNITPQQDTPADAPQEKKTEPVKEAPPAPEQPAPAPKVLDFTAARGDGGKPKATAKEAAELEDKPKRGRPAKAEKPTPEKPAAPRNATRSAEPEQIVYINLSELHPFKNHPFGVRDDTEMKGLVESVKASGVNQPALVRPREDGGYEIIAGHRRQKASNWPDLPI